MYNMQCCIIIGCATRISQDDSVCSGVGVMKLIILLIRFSEEKCPLINLPGACDVFQFAVHCCSAHTQTRSQIADLTPGRTRWHRCISGASACRAPRPLERIPCRWKSNSRTLSLICPEYLRSIMKAPRATGASSWITRT